MITFLDPLHLTELHPHNLIPHIVVLPPLRPPLILILSLCKSLHLYSPCLLSLFLTVNSHFPSNRLPLVQLCLILSVNRQSFNHMCPTSHHPTSRLLHRSTLLTPTGSVDFHKHLSFVNTRRNIYSLVSKPI